MKPRPTEIDDWLDELRWFTITSFLDSDPVTRLQAYGHGRFEDIGIGRSVNSRRMRCVTCGESFNVNECWFKREGSAAPY